METAHALEDRKDDLYQTYPGMVVGLLDYLQAIGRPMPHHLWECACGPGSIVQVLRSRGHTVHATDLVDYDTVDGASRCPDSEHGIDFLMERQARIDTEAIITNPPFKLANEFVRHALFLAPRVIMLLRLGFLESVERNDILDGGNLQRVHIFRNRV